MIYKPIFVACAALLVSQIAPAQPDPDPSPGTDQSQPTSPDADQSQPTSKTTTKTTTSTTSTTRRKASVASQAANMLVKTDQARKAIAGNNKAEALRDVDQAMAFADQVPRTAGGQMVPIYQELEEVAVVSPGAVAQTSRAQGYADRPEGAPQLEPSVRDVTGQYTSISVDMAGAKAHLAAAKAALQKDNFQQADSALAAVQNGVMLTSIESDLPLVRARQNLVLAKTMAQQGRAADAAPSLKAAADALQEYENTPGVQHASEAEQLRQEINSNLTSITGNSPDAVSKINGWSNQLSAWFPSAQRSQ
jgi:hypothetical protein